MAVAAAAGPEGAADFQGLKGFDDRNAPTFAVAIVGDLHLEPGPPMVKFDEARRQLISTLNAPGIVAPRVVQLGDLGGYKFRPGSRDCFVRGREYLAGFGVPTTLVIGNHDLEGDEFETDEENLAAWQAAFRQKHYWAADVGPATFIGLSTTRFRSNPWSAHEVHVDEEQMAFLQAKLEETAAAGRPVVVCTHAPILGSGLKVVQTVHVKNRCAWLNHSSNPHEFIDLVHQYPNIRLWFSGHFHLSHNYSDSISVVGGTAFVLTGVIGECNRDGFRHSRVLKGSEEGYEMFTMDHDSGEMRLDLAHRWDDAGPPKPVVPLAELICDPSAGWLCSKVDLLAGDGNSSAAAMDQPAPVTWLNAGPGRMLAVQDEIIVEYDTRSMSPVGVVCMDLPDDCTVVMRDAGGREVPPLATDGSKAVALEIVGADGELHQRLKRNHEGGFFQVYQHNKWVARKKKEAAEAAQKQQQQETVPAA